MSACDAIADSATTRSGSPGSTEISAPPPRVSSPTQTGTWITGSASKASSAPFSCARIGALRSSRIDSLAKGFIAGAASSSSKGTPRACS